MRAPRKILGLSIGLVAVGIVTVLALFGGLGAVSADSCTPPGVNGALGVPVCPPPRGGGQPIGQPAATAPPQAIGAPAPASSSGSGTGVLPDIAVVNNTGGATQPGAQQNLAPPRAPEAAGAQVAPVFAARPPARTTTTVLPATGMTHAGRSLLSLPLAALAFGTLLVIAGAFLFRRNPARR